MCSLAERFGITARGKRYSRLAIALFVPLAFCVLSRPVQAKYDGGAGTADDPYLIRTPEQLTSLGATPGDWDKDFKLVANIDLSDSAPNAYQPIGTEVSQSFSGVFDGNNCTISNLSVTSTREQYTGLFGYVSGQIKNLGLIKPRVSSQGWTVGALAGYLDSGTITGCYARRVDVSGGNNVGGLIGVSTGRLFNCYSSGKVSGDTYVGGLIGLVTDSTVNTSFSKASVSGNADVGGLAGKTGDVSSVLSNCYATGPVNGGVYVGGLVGQVERGRAYKCYSTGHVSGNQYLGGLTGYVRVLGDVIHCFWDTQASDQPTSAGGTGKTTAEMHTITTFTDEGWDFYNTWTICAGMDYPVLIWQIPPADFQCPDGVDFIDFAFFASHWHLQNCDAANGFCEGTDANHSGAVDFVDLQIFANHWLEGLP
jgi:The GLUG motif